MKSLVIAEKPSVARDIARVLGCKEKGDGFYSGSEYIITWALGHLVTLWEPEDYDQQYKSWSLKTLPILPKEMRLKPLSKTYKQFSQIKKLLGDKEVSTVICATDAGREGELIFRYIYSLCRCNKPLKRLWISSLTDEAIREGFRNLQDGRAFDNLFLSAKCRSESDWLVGMNATRAYTVKYKNLLSIGRVQTPTLAIIVNREKEIEHFKPTSYWEIKFNFGKYIGTWFDKASNDTKIWSQEEGNEILERAEGRFGTIVEINQKKVSKKPPLLYDLTELQRDANRRYGFTADRTLKVAQSLYEARKAITYPRTDSKHLTDDMIKTLKARIMASKGVDEGFLPHCEYLLALDKLPINKRIVDKSKVSDHHAIIPTEKPVDIKKLSEDEKKVLYLITARFIAAFLPDYIYDSSTIITEVRGEGFKTNGHKIIQLGWRAVFSSDDDENVEHLPPVVKGEELEIADRELLAKETQPPKRYTESMLLTAMEHAGKELDDEELREQMKDSGIGTPATRASIIERLIEVGYMTRSGKTLLPTAKGKLLIGLVPKELASAEMTGKWEKALNMIAKGKMGEERFMESIRNFTSFIVTDVSQKTATVPRFDKVVGAGSQKNPPQTSEALGNCPACETGKVLEGKQSFFCSNYKSGCKFGLFKNDKLMGKYKKKITKTIVTQLLKNQKASVKGMTSQSGGKFDGQIKLKLQESGYWGWEFDYKPKE